MNFGYGVPENVAAGSGESRKSIAKALTTVTMALLLRRRGRPDDALIRRTLFGWAFNTGRRTTGTPPTEIAQALTWASGASPQCHRCATSR